MAELLETVDPRTEAAARAHHETFNSMANQYGSRPRKGLAKPWDELSPGNQSLLRYAARAALEAAAQTALAAADDYGIGR